MGTALANATHIGAGALCSGNAGRAFLQILLGLLNEGDHGFCALLALQDFSRQAQGLVEAMVKGAKAAAIAEYHYGDANDLLHLVGYAGVHIGCKNHLRAYAEQRLQVGFFVDFG